MMNGSGYREFAMIKLNGECENEGDNAVNKFSMKRSEEFPGWDTWKARNKKGIEYEVEFDKKGDQIAFRTENLGICIENTTTVPHGSGKVYMAITGDQVAITDIRIG